MQSYILQILHFCKAKFPDFCTFAKLILPNIAFLQGVRRLIPYDAQIRIPYAVNVPKGMTYNPSSTLCLANGELAVITAMNSGSRFLAAGLREILDEPNYTHLAFSREIIWCFRGKSFGIFEDSNYKLPVQAISNELEPRTNRTLMHHAIKAVTKAVAAKNTPGTFAMTIGQSFFLGRSP